MKNTDRIESFLTFMPILIFVILSMLYYHIMNNLRHYSPDFYNMTQLLRNGNTFEFTLLIFIVFYLLVLPLLIYNLYFDFINRELTIKSLVSSLVAPVLFVLFYAIFWFSVHLFFTVLISALQLIFAITIVTIPVAFVFRVIKDKLKPKNAD